jgi:hypothetical protein
MKRCPKCDFSFVNFHHVCDFDGTDLVDDPDTLPISPAVSALAAATQSPFLRLVKSPVLITVLALAGLLSSLLLIVYFDAASQPNSSAASRAPRDTPDAANSIASQVPPVQPSHQITVPAPATTRSAISKPAKDRTPQRSVTASNARARLRSTPSNRNQQTRPEIALHRQPLQRQTKDKPLQKESAASTLQRDSKENVNRKESKLTAVLKTPWRILKKPFKF